MADENPTLPLTTTPDGGQNLGPQYWDDRYANRSFPWDLGHASAPMKAIIDSLPDKQARILIPGGGFGHELAYLHAQGYANVLQIDWSEGAVAEGQEKYPEVPASAWRNEDFFAHQGQYDVILEQTFFCALLPSKRAAYCAHMLELLASGGVLKGVLFDFPLVEHKGPPFGGDEAHYRGLFEQYFTIEQLERCTTSEPERAGKELSITLREK